MEPPGSDRVVGLPQVSLAVGPVQEHTSRAPEPLGFVVIDRHRWCGRAAIAPVSLGVTGGGRVDRVADIDTAAVGFRSAFPGRTVEILRHQNSSVQKRFSLAKKDERSSSVSKSLVRMPSNKPTRSL